MSRHHTLPPIVYTPAPPKPKETRRRRNAGSAQGTSAAEEADETEESGAPAQPTFAPDAGQAAPGAPPFKTAEQHIPPTAGKLSSDTLKTMLEVQEQTSAESSKDKL